MRRKVAILAVVLAAVATLGLVLVVNAANPGHQAQANAESERRTVELVTAEPPAAVAQVQAPSSATQPQQLECSDHYVAKALDHLSAAEYANKPSPTDPTIGGRRDPEGALIHATLSQAYTALADLAQRTLPPCPANR